MTGAPVIGETFGTIAVAAQNAPTLYGCECLNWPIFGRNYVQINIYIFDPTFY